MDTTEDTVPNDVDFKTSRWLKHHVEDGIPSWATQHVAIQNCVVERIIKNSWEGWWLGFIGKWLGGGRGVCSYAGKVVKFE